MAVFIETELSGDVSFAEMKRAASAEGAAECGFSVSDGMKHGSHSVAGAAAVAEGSSSPTLQKTTNISKSWWGPHSKDALEFSSRLREDNRRVL